MTTQESLENSIAIAKIQEERLRDAVCALNDVLPMDENIFSQLTRDQQAYLDMMAVRFTKLQDIMGAKIFHLLLERMKEPVEGKRFLDILAYLRELRNTLAHEYPDRVDLRVEYINHLHKSSLALLDYWSWLLNQMKPYLEKAS